MGTSILSEVHNEPSRTDCAENELWVAGHRPVVVMSAMKVEVERQPEKRGRTPLKVTRAPGPPETLLLCGELVRLTQLSKVLEPTL